MLRCILRHCVVPVSMPHSSGFARLAFVAFYFVVRFPTFYGTIKVESKTCTSLITLMHDPSEEHRYYTIDYLSIFHYNAVHDDRK